MKWSILILTQPSRVEFLARLLEVIKPQIEHCPDIELLIRVFDPTLSLGENRQLLKDQSVGEYVNFIDDDDLVPEDYVSSIYPNLHDVDYVGFQMQMYVDGSSTNPIYHSLRYDRWWQDMNGSYRDIVHLNPMRRELSQLVKMSGESGEDSRWSSALRSLEVLKTEAYVDKVMYYYYHRTRKSDGAK
jgi:glycosyl transferase family 2